MSTGEFEAMIDRIVLEHFPITGSNFYNDPDEAAKIVRHLATQPYEMQKAFCEELAELYHGQTLISTLCCLLFSAEERGPVLAHAICLATYSLVERLLPTDAKRRMRERNAPIIGRHEALLSALRNSLLTEHASGA
jgi:hypothetical protein